MANSILKLSVDTREYDSKLKNAAEGIQHLAKRAHDMQGEFANLDKAEVEFIKNLGYMNTSARTAGGNVRELETAYKNLAATYNQLNEYEKKDEGGKALATSLEMLKQRAQEARSAMNEATKSLADNGQEGKSSSTILDQLASKFTINFDAVTLMSKGLGVASQALDVAKEAFFSSETNVDEWGRTVEATGSIYQSFLQSLNNSDFSGFITGIGRVIMAAKDAYNAMDELYTRMTIINPERARLQARQTELKATIRRKGADSAEGKAAQAELKQMEPLLVKSFQTEGQMNLDAFKAQVRKKLAEGNITLSDKEMGAFLTTMSSDRLFRQFRANARGSKGTKVVENAYSDSQQIIKYDTRNKNKKLLDLFTDEWRQQNSGYLTAYYNANNQANSVLLGDARYVKDTKGTGGGSGRGGKNTPKVEEIFPEGSMKDLQRDMQELKKAQDLVTSPDEWQKYQQQIDAVTEKMNTLKGVVKKAPEMAEGVGGLNQRAISTYQSMLQESMKGMEYGSTDLTETLANSIDVTTLSNLLKHTFDEGLDITKMKFENGSPIVEELWNAILNGDNIPDKAWEELGAKISEELKTKGKKGIKVDTQTGAVSSAGEEKNAMQQLTAMNTMVNSLGSIAAGVQNLGIKVPEGISQSIAVLQTIMGIVGAIQTISTTKFLFSTGGIVHAAGGVMVPGNSFSGDNIPALLNSGELVLNRVQQGVLADALESDGNRGGGVPMLPYVSGDKIILGANNFLKGAGKGELVTTSFLRQKGLI